MLLHSHQDSPLSYRQEQVFFSPIHLASSFVSKVCCRFIFEMLYIFDSCGGDLFDKNMGNMSQTLFVPWSLMLGPEMKAGNTIVQSCISLQIVIALLCETCNHLCQMKSSDAGEQLPHGRVTFGRSWCHHSGLKIGSSGKFLFFFPHSPRFVLPPTYKTAALPPSPAPQPSSNSLCYLINATNTTWLQLKGIGGMKVSIST
jgi:hypothetical protein